MKSFVFLCIFLSVYLNAEVLMRTKVMMGTFVTISLDEKNKKYLAPAYKIIKHVDSSLSSFDKNSPIFKLNHNKTAMLNSYTYEALQLCEKYYKKTDKYFDISIGSITKDLYRFGGDERLPTLQELRKSKVSLDGLEFDKNSAILTKNIKIDLGGMGKGFAVSMVAAYFRKNGVKKAQIMASGDIRCLGSCKIAINNPFEEMPLATFSTKQNDMGISTSGNYNRYVKSRQNNHLINPKTKHSEKNFTSITLISQLPSSDLDAYATAVSVMPRKKAFLFLDSLKVGYIVLDNQKRLIVSQNISTYVDNLLINDTFKK